MPMRPFRALPSAIIAIAAIVIASTTTANAQSRDAAAVVERVRVERRALARQSLAATLSSRSIITVHANRSKLDLVPAQTIVYEAHGVYHRDADHGEKIRIVAVRATAPPTGISRGPIQNYSALGEIVHFDDDRIVVLNTSLVSPLADDAPEYYAFEHAGVERRAGVEVDVIRIVPIAPRRPLFEGRLFIARGTSGSLREGSLVAMELEPSATTAIPFITALRIVQTFTAGETGASLSDSLVITGRGVIEFAALGLAETHVDFSVASRLDDHRIGAPIPDSLRTQTERVVIHDDAHDAPASFWASRSSLTGEQVTTIEASRKARADGARSLNFSFGGMVDYNRAGGATPTLSAGATFGPLGASASGGYSFGLERPIGEGALWVSIGDPATITATLRGAAFSQITPTTTGDRSYPRVMNTLVAATLHQDYYDFFRKDGWSAGAEIGFGKLRLGGTLEQSRQFSIANNAKWSLLTWASKEFPPNPSITEGEYTTMQADLAYSLVSPFLKLTPIADDDLRFALTGLSGSRTGADTSFQLLEALVSYSLPVAETGYNPITLTMLAAAGTATASLPPQYQFRLRTSAATFGKPGGLVSPPKGRYGGTEYLALGAEVNLTDLPWRALGLPTVDGRGIELILAGAAARYRQAHPVGYLGMGDDWYAEAGVGFSRIPLFLTSIVYGRVDLRKGFGPLGKFGGNFTFVLPI